jgi:hypothetical protein
MSELWFSDFILKIKNGEINRKYLSLICAPDYGIPHAGNYFNFMHYDHIIREFNTEMKFCFDIFSECSKEYSNDTEEDRNKTLKVINFVETFRNINTKHTNEIILNNDNLYIKRGDPEYLRHAWKTIPEYFHQLKPNMQMYAILGYESNYYSDEYKELLKTANIKIVYHQLIVDKHGEKFCKRNMDAKHHTNTISNAYMNYKKSNTLFAKEKIHGFISRDNIVVGNCG